jgi:hypothetical protein
MLNPEGQYAFIDCNLSLIRNVDEACRQIKEKGATINLLVITIGTLVSGKGKSAMARIYNQDEELIAVNRTKRGSLLHDGSHLLCSGTPNAEARTPRA